MNPKETEVALAGRIVLRCKTRITRGGTRVLDLVVAKREDRNETFRVRTRGAVAEALVAKRARRFDPISLVGQWKSGEWIDSESGELRRGPLLVASAATLKWPDDSTVRHVAKGRRKTAAELSAILGRQLFASPEAYL